MRNPNNKIGIKTLTDEQLRASLPNWELIDYRLDSIRKEAEGVNLDNLEKEPFETLKYDQFFSILGRRGAGKTSVIYTLYEKFKTKDENIVLPIIMPELFEAGEGVLDWLFQAIDFKLKEIEDTLLNNVCIRNIVFLYSMTVGHMTKCVGYLQIGLTFISA